MNILYVTPSFAQYEKDALLSGMPFAVYKCACAALTLGYTPIILTIGAHDRRWLYNGIRVVSVENIIWNVSDSFFGTWVEVIQRERVIMHAIQMICKEEHIDVIQYAGWCGVGLLHKGSVPGVMRISSYTKTQLHQYYSSRKVWALSIIEKMAIKKMKYVFAPSKLMANAIEHDCGISVDVIETPFMEWQGICNYYVFDNLIGEKRYLLFFGRMTVDKGIYVIRDALYEILDNNKDIYIVFAGESSRKDGVAIEDQLKEAAGKYSDRLIFVGLIDRSILMPIIERAEAVLMPSLADNLPNACAEAMHMGRIVIGTNGSSIEQFIENDKSGILIEIGSSIELIQSVNEVLNMDLKRKEAIQTGAKKRVADFSIDVFAGKLDEIYKAVLK